MTTASAALTVAGTVMLFVSAGTDVREAREELNAELKVELETLPAALAELVVVGDFTTLLQTLDRYIERPRVDEATFYDASGAVLRSRAARRHPIAPAWFRSMVDFPDRTDAAEVRVGGRSYGRLELILSGQGGADQAWRRLINHLGVLALAVGLDFLGIWWVLRSGLAPLRQLEEGAAALAGGAFDQRLRVTGGPEIRRLMLAFNRMAAALQFTHGQLTRRNAELVRFSEISAHHLQEPARRLVIFSQRLGAKLRGRIDDPEVATSLGFIEQEAARLRNLLRDIELYLAAVQPLGKIQLCDAAAAAQAAIAHQAARLEAIGATATVGAAPAVLLDPRRLQEIFTILVDNAIRYRHPDRPLRIDISGAVVGDKARLTVADNGVGVPPEYRERVFRVFERLRPQEGDVSTGIGLAIVQRIAESTGGAVWIEGDEKEGTSVVVEFGLGPSA